MGLVNVNVREDEFKNSKRFRTYIDISGGVYKKCGINHVFMNFYHFLDATIVDLLSETLVENHRIHIFISDKKFITENLKWFIDNYHSRTDRKMIIHVPKSNVGLGVAVSELFGENMQYCKLLVDSCPTEFYMCDEWGFYIPPNDRRHYQVMLQVRMCPQSQHFIQYSYREKTQQEIIEENRRQLNAEKVRRENHRKAAIEKMEQVPGDKA